VPSENTDIYVERFPNQSECCWFFPALRLHDPVGVDSSKRERFFFRGEHAGTLWVGGDYDKA
jgi:hypothetical protein